MTLSGSLYSICATEQGNKFIAEDIYRGHRRTKPKEAPFQVVGLFHNKEKALECLRLQIFIETEPLDEFWIDETQETLKALGNGYNNVSDFCARLSEIIKETI